MANKENGRNTVETVERNWVGRDNYRDSDGCDETDWGWMKMMREEAQGCVFRLSHNKLQPMSMIIKSSGVTVSIVSESSGSLLQWMGCSGWFAVDNCSGIWQWISLLYCCRWWQHLCNRQHQIEILKRKIRIPWEILMIGRMWKCTRMHIHARRRIRIYLTMCRRRCICVFVWHLIRIS